MQMAVFRAASWGLTNGSPLFTGLHSVSNNGNFSTNTQETSYLSSVLNGANPTAIYYNGSVSSVDAIAGATLVPSTATVLTPTAVAGYLDDYCNSYDGTPSGPGSQCAGVGLFGVARASVNNAYVWGSNLVVKEANNGLSGHGLTGLEIDMSDTTTAGPSQFRGIFLAGSTANQVTGSNYNAIELNGTGWNTGLTIDRNFTVGGQAIQLYPACASSTFTLSAVNGSGTYTGVITGGAGNAYMGTAFTITGFSPANDLVDAVATASTATTLSFSVTTSPQSGINGHALVVCSSQNINFSGWSGSTYQQVYL